MRLNEEEVSIPALLNHKGLLAHVDRALRFRLADGESPVRFVVTETDAEKYRCEIGVIEEDRTGADRHQDSILLLKRQYEAAVERYVGHYGIATSRE